MSRTPDRREDRLALRTKLGSPVRAPSDFCLAMAKESSRKRLARRSHVVQSGHPSHVAGDFCIDDEAAVRRSVLIPHESNTHRAGSRPPAQKWVISVCATPAAEVFPGVRSLGPPQPPAVAHESGDACDDKEERACEEPEKGDFADDMVFADCSCECS
jgi:hypothetical protein